MDMRAEANSARQSVNPASPCCYDPMDKLWATGQCVRLPFTHAQIAADFGW
jgi:hypothetical protein